MLGALLGTCAILRGSLCVSPSGSGPDPAERDLRGTHLQYKPRCSKRRGQVRASGLLVIFALTTSGFLHEEDVFSASKPCFLSEGRV